MKTIVHRTSLRWRRGKAAPPEWRLGISRKTCADPPALFAAMHAIGFCVTLSHELRRKSVAAGEIAVTSSTTMAPVTAGWTNTGIHLTVVTRLPGLTQARFIDATIQSKARCALLRVPRTQVSMNARLES